jgi:hypothetical protein
MAGDELDSNAASAMLGVNLNTPGSATPTVNWAEEVAAELNSLRLRMKNLEDHAKWATEQLEESRIVNQRLDETVHTLTKTMDDQAAVIDYLGKTKPSSSTNEIKGADPPVFEGNSKELDAWILACRLRFSLQPSKFAAEATKVQFATTFLKGPPKAWVNPLASKFLVDRSGVPEFESFETFVTSIRSLYGDPNLSANASNQLKIIKQTTSVSEYYSRFIGFSQHTTHNDEGLRDFFYAGLKEGIKDDLAKIPRCLTLESLRIAATQLDSREQERRWEKTHLPNKNPDPPANSGTRFNYTRPPPIQQPPSVPPRPYYPTPAPRQYQAPAVPPPRPVLPRPPAAPSDGPTPMELDAQRMLQPLTPAEREQCLREGRCTRCRLHGHSVWACPGRFAIQAMEIALSENDQGQE